MKFHCSILNTDLDQVKTSHFQRTNLIATLIYILGMFATLNDSLEKNKGLVNWKYRFSQLKVTLTD